MIKVINLIVLVLVSCMLGNLAFAAGLSGQGAGVVASKVIGNLGPLAKLITAGAYVAGMAFVVGAIVKFKAHKDNPTQIQIGQPIALLFVGAALIFVPTVFNVSGGTLFGGSGVKGGISGLSSF